LKRRRHAALIGVWDNGSGMLPAFVRAIEERRLKIRYPVRLAVYYRTVGRSQHLSGVGHTVNMSSSGLLFECEHTLPPGTRIEATLEWPSLLDESIPLQLVTVGRIVRSEGSTCGMAFVQYQFRTMKRRENAAAGAPKHYQAAAGNK
jgi:hypothetical protein